MFSLNVFASSSYTTTLSITGTYALNIMVVHVFETFGEYCKHPLDVLAYFMSHYSSFSWDRLCVSAFEGASERSA